MIARSANISSGLGLEVEKFQKKSFFVIKLALFASAKHPKFPGWHRFAPRIIPLATPNCGERGCKKTKCFDHIH